MAAATFGGHVSDWLKIRSAYESGNVINVPYPAAPKFELEAYYVESGWFSMGNIPCNAGYIYIGPNRASEHGGFCVRLVSNNGAE